MPDLLDAAADVWSRIVIFLDASFVLHDGNLISKRLGHLFHLQSTYRCFNAKWFPNSVEMPDVMNKNHASMVRLIFNILPMLKQPARSFGNICFLQDVKLCTAFCQSFIVDPLVITRHCSHVLRICCKTGNLELIKWLFTQYTLNWKHLCENNFLAFDLACIFGGDEVIEWMLYDIIPPYVHLFNTRATEIRFRARAGQSCIRYSTVSFAMLNSLKHDIKSRTEHLTILSNKLARFKLDVLKSLQRLAQPLYWTSFVSI
jgi:hypothetical protein